jgi:2-dehydro-3-deoxy-D-arabinonate dehydratase
MTMSEGNRCVMYKPNLVVEVAIQTLEASSRVIHGPPRGGSNGSGFRALQSTFAPAPTPDLDPEPRTANPSPMSGKKLCRFTHPSTGCTVRLGLLPPAASHLLDLSVAGIDSLTALLDTPDLAARLTVLEGLALPRVPLAEAALLPPIEQQEVWAAGVTYLRSKKARMEESDFSASAYDRVYDAPRPELFFKSMPQKVVGPGAAVGIRSDARWNVPEPELALVFNRRLELVGFTAGNDMSSRDIEGENLLYLPQAKMYRASCALGPFITVGVEEATVRTWTIGVRIVRAGVEVFAGETSLGNLKRTFTELQGWLGRSQEFPFGAILLTGTGVVPQNDFTLAAGDVVTVHISGVGDLTNPVAVV